MKKILSIIVLLIILGSFAIMLTGCTLQIETTDNSVSASVDEGTSEKVDNIVDWIKQRLSRLFNNNSESSEEKVVEKI